MPRDEWMTISGEVTDIFVHRFVIKTDDGKVLADIGPKGAERVALRIGERVEVSGEMKPSELKVRRIAKRGEKPIDIEHKKKPHEGPDGAKADPKLLVRVARDAGFAIVGEPRRKPKHFEVLGRKPDGGFAELHVELDGKLRHERPVAKGDHKWAAEIGAAG